MKLWIIICVIAFVVLRIIAVCLANYIKNDKTERMKYILNDGETTLGLWQGLCAFLSTLTGAAVVILFIILVLEKL